MVIFQGVCTLSLHVVVEMQRETTVQTQQHDKGSDSEGLPPFIIPPEQGSSKEGTKACSREETLSSSSIFTQEFLDHTRGGC